MISRLLMCVDLFAIDFSRDKHWSAYVQCGLRGVIEHVASISAVAASPRPFLLLVDGTVPSSAGLSSSSSLVCASALSVAAINGWDTKYKIDKKMFANIATTSGTTSYSSKSFCYCLNQHYIGFSPLKFVHE